MYRTIDASSPAAVLYYILLIFLGCFFVVRAGGRRAGRPARGPVTAVEA